MSKNMFLIIGGVIVALVWVIGIVGLATSAPSATQQWSTRLVVSGTIAMMGGLFAFVLGFVHMATVGNQSPSK